MKVLFDSQIFDWQINGGISRYFVEILRRLEQDPDMEVIFRCRHSYNTYIQGTRWLTNRPALTKIRFKGKLTLVKEVNQVINRPYSNRILGKGTFDIFHPTYYDPYFIKYLGSKPFVLTVYDLTNEKFNDHSAQTRKILNWKKQLIQAASHIVAISENTRKDVIEYYNIEPSKVTTVYLAGGFEPSIHEKPPVPEMQGIPERFILFVGSRSSYKNFAGFIKEAAPVVQEQQLSVVVAGGGPLGGGEVNLLRELGIADNIIAFSHVSDVFLSQLYRKALVFVFPSLYEGFGLPVLEAMQCECPTLLSNNSSLPEVGGDAAAYFDPFMEGALRQKLNELLNNKAETGRMKIAGKMQVLNFNWDATAAGHTRVYKNIVG